MVESPFIQLAEHVGLKNRSNMNRVSLRVETDEGTEIYKRIRGDIDAAICILNDFLRAGTVDLRRSTLLRYTQKFLNNDNLPQEFPTIKQLELSSDYGMFRSVVKTMHLVNGLMKKGEHPKPEKGAWVLQTREGIDEDKLLASTMIAVYAKFISIYYESHGYQSFGDITFPLEEILAIYLPNSYVFQLFREWYILDEGFSKELVELVKTLPIELLATEITQLKTLSHHTDLAADLHTFGKPMERQIQQIGAFQRCVEALTEKYGLSDEVYSGWHRQFLD